MSKQFIKFALVGCLGFLIDAMVFWLASHWLPFASARALSFWVAVTSNWWFNRLFTFKEAERSERLHRQWSKFFIVCLLGFIPNWGIFVSLMWLGHLQGIAHWPWYPYVAMVPGILAGMMINFSLSRGWVFKP